MRSPVIEFWEYVIPFLGIGNGGIEQRVSSLKNYILLSKLKAMKILIHSSNFRGLNNVLCLCAMYPKFPDLCSDQSDVVFVSVTNLVLYLVFLASVWHLQGL